MEDGILEQKKALLNVTFSVSWKLFRNDSFPGLYLSSLRLEMGVGHFLKLLMWLEVGDESSSDPRVLQLCIRQKINTWCVSEDGSILRNTLKDVDDLESKNS